MSTSEAATISAGRQYAAFISYSHTDAEWARWLHRRLESFRLPKSVRTRSGQLPCASIRPVFLDKADMGAVADLDAAISAALAASKCLVVVCSPACAASPRVAREIEYFKHVQPEGRVLTVIVAGRPNAVARGLDPSDEAFPQDLRGPGGRASYRSESLSADLRPNRGGKRDALLKLVAGILDIPLDALYQRDQQRLRRRWTIFGVAAASIVALTTTLGTYAWHQRSAAIQARARAEKEAANARQTTDFLVELFNEVDPARTRGQTLLAREVMDRGLERARKELKDRPDVQVPLMIAIGNVYKNLGLYPQSEEVLRETLRLGEESKLTRQLPEIQAALASALANLDKYAEAEALVLQAISVLESDPGRQEELHRAQAFYGYLLWRMEQAEKSRVLLADLREKELARTSGVATALLADILEDLGRATRDMGDAPKALEYISESVRIRKQLLGEDNYWYGNALSNLGFAYWHLGRYREAADSCDQARAVFEKVLGPEHPWVAIALYGSGGALVDLGEIDRAVEHLERAIALFERNQLSGSFEGINSLGILGRAYGAREEWDEALPLFERATEQSLKNSGPMSPAYAGKIFEHAFYLFRAGQTDPAIGKIRQAIAISETTNLGNPKALRLYKQALADALCSRGPSEEGLALSTSSLAAMSSSDPQWSRAIAESVVASCQPLSAGIESGEATISGALETVARERGEHSLQARDMVRRWVNFYKARGKPDKAATTARLLTSRFSLVYSER